MQDRRGGADVGHAKRVGSLGFMAPSSRDRISVDLRGLKSALIERARAQGASPSNFVRAVLARVLEEPIPSMSIGTARQGSFASRDVRVRLSMRLDRREMEAIISAADRAGLSVGAYVAGLAAGIPALSNGITTAENLAALVASNAAMAALSRNLHHLTSLLGLGSIRAAQEYRDVLNSTAGEVRRHLAFASAVLADLRPLRVAAHLRSQGDRPAGTEIT
jgi:hypothetical protein